MELVLHMCLCYGIFLSVVNAQGNGAVRLFRAGQTSHLFSSGVVQIYHGKIWGNICHQNDWDSVEADVVCRQMGWSGASDTDPAILATSTYGVDLLPTVIDNVDCTNNSLSVLLQCSFSIEISYYCSDNLDVTVSCYTTKLWDQLVYPGFLRLVGGSYITEGRVEIYCNGQWGTVCDDALGPLEADTICRQLGYSEALNYDHLKLPGNHSDPIWLDNVECDAVESCIGSCQRCPVAADHDCRHAEDLTVSCTYIENTGGSNLDTCDGEANSIEKTEDISVGVIVGVAIGGGILIMIFIIPVCICCFIGCHTNESIDIPSDELEKNENAQNKSTPIPYTTTSPEVVMMESSPKMFRRGVPQREHPIVSYPSNSFQNNMIYPPKPSAINPYFPNDQLPSSTENECVTTPPAYMGYPAPQY